MNIVVCVKQVPDSWAEKRLTAADRTLDRESADAVMNELDEFAVSDDEVDQADAQRFVGL
jgi:electron transfer flavoprotein beta subunit